MMIFNAITWDVDPVMFKAGAFALRYYGFFFVLAFVVSYLLLRRFFKREQISLPDFERFLWYTFIGAILGARLGHCFFYDPAYYLANPLEILLPLHFLDEGGFKFVGFQGMASHGGAIGLIIAVYLYSRKTKNSFIRAFDLIVVASPLGAFFIRLANLMNSEIVGVPTNSDWGFIFTRIDQIPRHPAQLYEAIAYLVVFLIMITLYYTVNHRIRKGGLFGIALTIGFSARFMIEFVKVPQTGFENDFVLNMGQILSVPFIVSGLILIVFGVKAKKLGA